MTHRSKSSCIVLALWLAVGLFQCTAVYAQVAGATLSGVITDASGGAVPNATVSINNMATGVTREVATDRDGLYRAPNLLPGNYDVTVSSTGFSTAVQKGVVLSVGADQVLNLALKVGQMSERIEVTAATPSVDLGSATVSGNIDSTTVRELPLNGRDWTTLATLQSGVATVPVQQPNQGSAPKGNRGYGNQMTISGTRPQQNNYRLDGVSINDYSNGAPGSVVGLNLGVDAIAEFSVLTSNYSAEYGRTSGGVINAITKSGTNSFHGDVFEFLRNSALDARNFFDGNTVPPFKRNQFGAFVGGPIIKDKTFIFGGYEGLRQSLTGTVPTHVPSLTARTGQICDATPTCVTHPLVVGIVPGTLQYLNAFWPAPLASDQVCNTNGCAPGNSGDIAVTNIQNKGTAREDFLTFRVDHKLAERDSLFGTYLFDDATTHSPDPLNTWLAGNLSRRQVLVLEESHIFSPSLANTVRFGFSREAAIVNSTISPINPASSDKTFSIFSTTPQFAPQVNIGGYQGSGGGLGSDPTYQYHWNSFQLYDDASWVRGLHSFKFGFAMERMQDNVIADLQPTGLLAYGSPTAFLQNSAAFTQGKIPGFLTPRGIRETLWGGYVQDDWRILPHLTLNLGLRYEMTTVPTEVQGKLTNLRMLTLNSPPSFHGSPYFQNPTKKNFEPRIGLAWDPFGDGKTSVRAAFGFFDFLPLPAAFSLMIDQSEPFYKFFSTGNIPANGCTPFPSCIGDQLNNPNGAALQTAWVENKPPRNYVMIWNLNIQRELTKNSSLMVGYVGNRGVHMLNREDDINGLLPVATPNGLLMPINGAATAPQCTEAQLNVFSAGGGGCFVNRAFGTIRGIYWGGDSFYDALEAQFKQKFGAGFQLEASYTWGKAIDTGSATVIGDPFQTSISSPYFFCRKCRRSLSDFDIRHSLSTHMLWEVPSPKNWGGTLASVVLGGWELGSIITAQSGVPFTPILAPDFLGQGNGDPWAFPSVVNSPGCKSLVNPGNPNMYVKIQCLGVPLQGSIPNAQCAMVTDPTTLQPACSNLFGNVRRNSLIGPKLVNVDFSVYKNFPVHRFSEKFNVQFRTEMFNLFNHSNFAPPINNIAFIAAGGPGGASQIGGAGAIDRTTTTSRQIQFGLKVIW